MSSPVAIERGNVYAFYCDEDGRRIKCEYRCYADGSKPIQRNEPNQHRFLIVSPSDYNKKSVVVLAIPITSKETKFNLDADAEPIGPDDFEEIPPNHETKGFVLLDKICRVNTTCLCCTNVRGNKQPEEYGKLKGVVYKKLVRKAFSKMGVAVSNCPNPKCFADLSQTCPLCGTNLLNP